MANKKNRLSDEVQKMCQNIYQKNKT